jgi:short-subunit dehydrogenase
MKKNALIIGANSKIAFELSKILAKDNYNLFLLSKNYNQLKKNSVYLKQISKSKIEAYRFDISHPLSFNKVLKKFCKVELLVVVSGFLDINDRNNIKTNKTNYLGPINFIQKILTIHNNFREIICFTSVAGDRIDASLDEYSNSVISSLKIKANLRKKIFT